MLTLSLHGHHSVESLFRASLVGVDDLWPSIDQGRVRETHCHWWPHKNSDTLVVYSQQWAWGTLCVITPGSWVVPVGTACVSSGTVVTRHQQLLLAWQLQLAQETWSSGPPMSVVPVHRIGGGGSDGICAALCGAHTQDWPQCAECGWMRSIL